MEALEKLRKRGKELLSATCTDKDSKNHLHVVARLSREDGALMLEVADEIEKILSEK